MGEVQNLENRGKSIPTSPTSPPDDPIFASAHSALMFAFNFTHGTLKPCALGQLPPGGGRGLGGLDGAAQSGMILAELGNLVTVRRMLLTGKFSPAYSQCSCRAACCGGRRENSSWAEAVDWLTEYVLAEGLTGMISHHRLRRSIVARYFGRKQSFVEIADSCGVHRTTASEYNKAVVERFRVEERSGLYEIEARLKRAGIVAT